MQEIAPQKVFIVHGHDEAAKYAAARFIENLGLKAIILDEQPSESLTIIKKFEKYANESDFAIVLLTPDDVGAPIQERDNLKLRARQNVIYELGYFSSALGRKGVCVLYKEGVELPSDIYGVVYVPMDKFDGWQLKLMREMKSAGLHFDANKFVET
ncbi:MAG: nucleotide-binding protein [Candidatus Poribacteria bacterium]|nr:nucleotide-binding protein [Candidatus Poribacteria bacterium]